MKAQVEAMIEANPVLVMATSTCPFCIEVRGREETTIAHCLSWTIIRSFYSYGCYPNPPSSFVKRDLFEGS